MCEPSGWGSLTLVLGLFVQRKTQLLWCTMSSSRRTRRRRQQQSLRRHQLRVEGLEKRYALDGSSFVGPEGWGWIGVSPNTQVKAVAEDSTGSVYIAGTFSGTVDVDFSDATYELASNGVDDAFVAKYTGQGGFVWAKSFGSSGKDRGYTLAIANDDSIRLGGFFSETVDFDPGVGSAFLKSVGAGDGFVLALDSAGNYQWAGQFGGTGISFANGDGDFVNAVVVDATGNTVVGGVMHYSATASFGGEMATVTGSGMQNSIILKIDSQGILQWTKHFDSSFLNGVGHIAASPNGDVIVGGGLHTHTMDADPGPGFVGLTNAGVADAYLVALDSEGAYRWGYSYGSNAEESTGGVTTDSLGNVYIVAGLGGTHDLDPGVGTVPFTADGNQDLAVISFDEDGVFRWAETFGGIGSAGGHRLIFDGSGDLVVSGFYETSLTMPDATTVSDLVSNGSYDNFVLWLDAQTGTPQRAINIGTSGNENQTGTIAQSGSNGLLIGGTLGSGGNFLVNPEGWNFLNGDGSMLTVPSGGGGYLTRLVGEPTNPTLDALSDVNINEDAGEQTVNLTGINAGGGEAQPLRVTATSNNTGLIPDPTVTYSSADSTGTLKFTPVANQFGTAAITVTVEDGGIDNNLATPEDNGTTTQTATVTVAPSNDAPNLHISHFPQGTAPNGHPLEVSPVGNWLFRSGSGSGGTSYYPATLDEVSHLVSHGYVTYSNSGHGWFQESGNPGSYLRSYETYIRSNIDQTISYQHGGNDSSALFIDDVFVGGAGNMQTVSGSLQLTANVPVKLLLVGYDAIPGHNVWMKPVAADNLEAISGIELSAVPFSTHSTTDDVVLSEDAPEQTLYLAGISAGGGESQPLRVTATSDNESLIPGPTIAYTSPNATGTLKFTPVSGRSGTATITVMVEDGGLDTNLATAGDNAVASQVFNVTVEPTNSPPSNVTLTDAVNTISETADTSSAIRIAGIDVTDDELGSNIVNLSGPDASSFYYTAGFGGAFGGGFAQGGIYLNPGIELGAASKPSFQFTVEVSDTSLPGSDPVTVDHTLSVQLTSPWGYLLRQSPQGNWLHSSGPGPSQSSSWYPTTMPSAESLTEHGYASYLHHTGTPAGWFTQPTYDSNQYYVFETHVLSETTQDVGFILGGNDGHSLFIDDAFVAGDGFNVSNVHGTLSLQAGVPIKVTLVSYNAGGDTHIVFVTSGGQNIEDIPGISISARSYFLEPTFDMLSDININEDDSHQTVSLTGITAGLNENQELRVTATSDNTGLIPDPTVTYSSADPTGTLAFTPVADQFGTATVTVTVEDGGLDNNLATPGDNATTTQTFDVTVNPVNDDPTLDAISDVDINENAGEQTVNLTGITAGGGETQVLSVTAFSDNTGLIPDPTVTFDGQSSTGTLKFTPVADQFGTATITVTVEDGGLDNDLGTPEDNGVINRTVVVKAEAVNDEPTLDALSDININEDDLEQTVNLTGITAGGGETQVLSVTATSDNTGLIPDPTVDFDGQSSTGTLKFTPVADQFGTATITVTVEDGGLDNDLGTPEDNGVINRTVVVMTEAVNDEPMLDALSDVNINEDAGEQTVNLTGITAGGGETQVLSITAVSDNTGLIPDPTVDFDGQSSTGTLKFTPVADQFGTATITVTVEDGGLDDDLATPDDNGVINRTVVVMTEAVNDEPTLDALSDINIYEDDPARSVGLLGLSSGDGLVIVPEESRNLIVNGSFADGNTGFNTEYTDSGGNSWPGGSFEYAIVDNDDYSGDGHSLYGNSVNHASTTTGNQLLFPVIWSQSVSVTPGETYDLSAWVKETSSTTNPSILEFTINSEVVGEITAAGSWKQFASTWNAGSSVQAEIMIVEVGARTQTPGGGNDFAIDDIEFKSPSIQDQPLQIDVTSSDSSLIAASSLTTSPVNYGDLYQWTESSGGNGHWYELVSSSLSWETAREAAQNRGGDLAVVTTSDEITFLTANVSEGYPWLGGYQDSSEPGFSEPESGWTWINDESWTGLHWRSDEPNDPNGSEQHLGLNLSQGKFFDADGTLAIPERSYLVEYETDPRLLGLQSGQFLLSPQLNQFGTATITVTVEDGGLDNDLATPGDNATVDRTFTVNVAPVNDDPTLDALSDVNINEDDPEQTVSLTGITAGGGETQVLSVTAVSDNTGLIPDPTVDFDGQSSTGTLKFIPVADQFGTATITVTVEDGGLDNDLGTPDDNGVINRTVFIGVAPINDDPTLDALSDININEDDPEQAVNLTGITAGGGEAQVLSITATSDNTGLIPDPTVDFDGQSSTGTLKFTPIADQFGTATITVTVRDGGLDNDLGTPDDNGVINRTVFIGVAPINDAPTLDALSDININEDDPEQTVNLTGITAGPNETQDVRVTAVSSDTNLVTIGDVQYPASSWMNTGRVAHYPLNDTSPDQVIDISDSDTSIAGLQDATYTFNFKGSYEGHPAVEDPRYIFFTTPTVRAHVQTAAGSYGSHTGNRLFFSLTDDRQGTTLPEWVTEFFLTYPLMVTRGSPWHS